MSFARQKALLAALGFVSLTGCSLVFPWSSLERGTGGKGASSGMGSASGSSTASTSSGQRCNLDQPFGTVTRIPGTVDQPNTNERAGRLTADESTLLFSRDDGSGLNARLYAAHKDGDGQFQSDPQPIIAGQSGYSDMSPFLLSDMTTLYFERFNGVGADDHIYRATRAGPMSAFGPPKVVTDLLHAGSESDPFFANESSLYFADGYDADVLYHASFAANAFTPPAMIGAPNGARPAVTNDERSLYAGRPSAGMDRIELSKRKLATDPWGPPMPVDELNDVTTAQDPSWISPDGCVIVFERLYSGSYDLFWAHK